MRKREGGKISPISFSSRSPPSTASPSCLLLPFFVPLTYIYLSVQQPSFLSPHAHFGVGRRITPLALLPLPAGPPNSQGKPPPLLCRRRQGGFGPFKIKEGGRTRNKADTTRLSARDPFRPSLSLFYLVGKMHKEQKNPLFRHGGNEGWASKK